MKVRRHPDHTEWAIYNTDGIIPTSLDVSGLSDPPPKYLVVKDIGSGPVIVSTHSGYNAAETRWIELCNGSEGDGYLSTGRSDETYMKPKIHKLVVSLKTTR
jgi:hypothetical protein